MSPLIYPVNPHERDAQLTEHFALREMAVSAEHPELARQLVFTELEVYKMFYLAHFVLEPVRMFAERLVAVLSGKRTPELNQRVGGSDASQHMLCEAVDFKFLYWPGEVAYENVLNEALKKTFNWLGLQPIMTRAWHQVIIYYTDVQNGDDPVRQVAKFIHISVPGLGQTKQKGAFYHYKGKFHQAELWR